MSRKIVFHVTRSMSRLHIASAVVLSIMQIMISELSKDKFESFGRHKVVFSEVFAKYDVAINSAV